MIWPAVVCLIPASSHSFGARLVTVWQGDERARHSLGRTGRGGEGGVGVAQGRDDVLRLAAPHGVPCEVPFTCSFFSFSLSR